MRLLAFAVMGLLVSWGSVGRAATVPKLSVCPLSDFLLLYDDDASVELSTDQMETVDAAVARSRQCNLQSIEVFSTSTAAEQSLWQRRVEAVREALVAHGIDKELIQVRTAATAELPDWWDSSRGGEGVVALIHFR